MKPAALAALLLLAVPVQTLAAEPTAAQHLASAPLTIRTATRTLHFHAEVARTYEQQEIGLMFRKSMAADHGMIFQMAQVAIQSFWMKNTFIPLDLIFIRQDGTISSIAANARPLDESPINSTEPVASILELNGGAAARDGIRPGDHVRW